MRDFDIGKWLIKLLNLESSFERINDYLTDTQALDLHISQYNLHSYSEKIDNFKVTTLKESSTYYIWREQILNDIESAFEIYSSQMIVILATYVENMNSEFFECLFQHNHKMIYNYASLEQKGYIKLNMVLEAEDKNELIEKLIQIAKKNAINGSLLNIKERIFKMTKYDIDRKLVNDIQLFVLNKRHTIIHESKNIDINKDKIVEYAELIKRYLLELGKACQKNKIPYLDQANLLE